MITPKELRIGNFIYDTTTMRVVEVKWVHADFKALDPIPLTAEWLTKFGFVESNSYNKKEKHFKKDGFTQLADYGGQIIILPEGGFAYLSCGYYENTIDCEYVHQLQNLYFALTGEELTIKETV